jgi:hypothetical protein
MSDWYERSSNLARVARALNDVDQIVQMLEKPWNWGMDFAALVPCDECKADVGEPCRGIDDGRVKVDPHTTRMEDSEACRRKVPCACTTCTHEGGYVEPDTNALVCRACEEADPCPVCHGSGWTFVR